MDTSVDWGTFLPQRIRTLLLNMSRYFFDDILAANNHSDAVASENFFGALEIFVKGAANLNELFASGDHVQLHWPFL